MFNNYQNNLKMKNKVIFMLISVCISSVLFSCSYTNDSKDYLFPPAGAHFPYVMHRIDPFTDDTISSKQLESIMFDDGLFLLNDKGYMDTETMTYQKDTAKSHLEINISNEYQNRVLKLSESFRIEENDKTIGFIQSETLARFNFEGSTIFFSVVFDGVPIKYVLEDTHTEVDVLNWTENTDLLKND